MLKHLLTFTILLFTIAPTLGQGFSYSFEDPCTFKTKTIYINNPSGNVFLTYNGQYKSFTPAELQSGAFTQWVNQIKSTNVSGPCSGVALVNSTQMNSYIAMNSLAVMNSVMGVMNMMASMNTGTMLVDIAPVVTNISNAQDANTKTKSESGTEQFCGQEMSYEKASDGTTIHYTQDETGNVYLAPTTVSPPNQATQSTSSDNSTSNASNNANNSTNSDNSTSSVNTDATANNIKPNDTKSVSNGVADAKTNGSVKSKVAEAKKGGLILTGDVVVIRSAVVNEKDQFRMNLSFTKANTKNTIVTGSLLNFTTGVKNSAFTVYRGYRFKNLTLIGSNTSMLNFEMDLFNTTSIMSSYKMNKTTATLGVNYTLGSIGKSNFNSFTSMVGVMRGFNLNKNWSINAMTILVYSPYIYYYEGLWYKSGFLFLPFTALDYKITNKFKLNLSFSGVHQVKDQTLNYQVLLGGKAIL